MHACVYEFVFLSAARRLSKLKKSVHVPHPRAPQYTAPHGWSLAGIARGVASPVTPASRHSWVAMQAARSRCRARARAAAQGRGTNTHGFCWRAPAGCLVSSRTRAGARSISSSGSARRSGNERGSAAAAGVGTERRTNEAPGRACGTRVSHPARRRRCLGRHAHMRLNSLVIPPVARVPVAGRP